MNLNDLYGIPFEMNIGGLTYRFSPPTLLFFKELMLEYNVNSQQVEHQLGKLNDSSARLEAVLMVIRLMHIGLKMANPDEAWNFVRVQELIKENPSCMNDFLEKFTGFMRQGGPAKKS